MRVDSFLKKKLEKSANQQARIPHFGKEAGHPVALPEQYLFYCMTTCT
jgi:hypothetical protein